MGALRLRPRNKPDRRLTVRLRRAHRLEAIVAEQLKNFFDRRVIAAIASELARVHPSFPEQEFVREQLGEFSLV